MRKLLMSLALGIVSSSLVAQLAEPVLFKETIHDFGEITEEAGTAIYEFVFTNNSGRPLKIITVQASCGCTTPGWTQEPIAAGKTGFVKASFDPRGRPGYFNKTLTVTTDYNGNPIVLQIKGQVVGKTSTFVNEWPVTNGSLKMKANSFNLGRIFINKEPVPKEFPVFNPMDKPITFIKVTSPSYLRVELPPVLNSNEKGLIKITYDVRQKKQYGFTSDNIELETDDPVDPLKSISVYATVEEYFSTLSGDDLAKAPVLKPSVVALDFGRLRQGTDGLQEVVLKNEGKKELIIRALQPNCSCITTQLETMSIKSGAEVRLKIFLATQGRAGTQQKAVTIYSNDPKNPVQRITLTGYIQ